MFRHPAERTAQNAAGRRIPNHLDGRDESDASGAKGSELLVKFRALGELPRRQDERHKLASDRACQVMTRSRLVLRSRLLRRPTIWSATWPPLKINKVGIALMPCCVAKLC